MARTKLSEGAGIIAWGSLTPKQKRRVRMWIAGFSVRRIAAVEGVSRQAIEQSNARSFKILPPLYSLGYDFRPP